MENCQKCDECYDRTREEIVFLYSEDIQSLTEKVRNHVRLIRMYAHLCDKEQCEPCSDRLERTNDPKSDDYKMKSQALENLISSLDSKLKM